MKTKKQIAFGFGLSLILTSIVGYKLYNSLFGMKETCSGGACYSNICLLDVRVCKQVKSFTGWASINKSLVLSFIVLLAFSIYFLVRLIAQKQKRKKSKINNRWYASWALQATVRSALFPSCDISLIYIILGNESREVSRMKLGELHVKISRAKNIVNFFKVFYFYNSRVGGLKGSQVG